MRGVGGGACDCEKGSSDILSPVQNLYPSSKVYIPDITSMHQIYMTHSSPSID
jgi:hypothetical protein